MSKKDEALRLALELLDKQWQCTQVWSLEEAQDVADNIREALADQCVCGEPDTPGTHRTDGPCLAEPPARQRIDYRAECWPESPHYKPAQQQEPVAGQPLPCPFCGHKGLDFDEGSTYRWGVASCSGCGASCGEIRREYPDQGQWHTEAIAEWNRRTSPPAQQQEPVAWHDKIKGMEVSMDVSTGEDDAHNRIYGRVYEVILEDGEGTPNAILAIEEDRNFTSPPASRPVKVWDAEGYDALCQELEGWKAKAQRKPWVGLTDEEVKHQWEIWRANIPRYAGFARGLEAKLREKNT